MGLLDQLYPQNEGVLDRTLRDLKTQRLHNPIQYGRGAGDISRDMNSARGTGEGEWWGRMLSGDAADIGPDNARFSAMSNPAVMLSPVGGLLAAGGKAATGDDLGFLDYVDAGLDAIPAVGPVAGAVGGLLGTMALRGGDLAGTRKALGPMGDELGAIVYHGSPHKFDKFSSSGIGTGEGAQAYGHGLYFADDPGVAGSYKQAAGIVEVDGVPLRVTSDVYRPGNEDMAAAHWVAKKGGVDEAIAHVTGNLSTGLPRTTDPQRFIPAIERLRGRKVEDVAGNLYKTDLPDDAIAKMLDWDAPLSEQPEAVRDALKDDVFGAMSDRELLDSFLASDVARSFPHAGEVTIANRILEEANPQYLAEDVAAWAKSQRDNKGMAYNLFENDSGGTLHGRMVARMGGQDAAAAKLKELGIPGIKFLDGNSRAAGEGSRNYVTFDDGLLTILERNGETINPPPGLLGEASADLIKRDGLWELSKIETPPDARGQGLAEDKLAQVLADADAAGVAVSLTPSSDFGASKGRLSKWYKKHGFVPNKGRNKDFTTMQTLIRPAKSRNQSGNISPGLLGSMAAGGGLGLGAYYGAQGMGDWFGGLLGDNEQRRRDAMDEAMQ